MACVPGDLRRQDEDRARGEIASGRPVLQTYCFGASEPPLGALAAADPAAVLALAAEPDAELAASLAAALLVAALFAAVLAFVAALFASAAALFAAAALLAAALSSLFFEQAAMETAETAAAAIRRPRAVLKCMFGFLV